MKLVLLVFSLFFPQSRSLKEKRRIVNGFKDFLRTRVNVSFAEVDFQDKWQRARFAITWVVSEDQASHQIEREIKEWIANRPEITVTQVERSELL